MDAEVGQARLRCALLRTRLIDDIDMIRTSETLYQAVASCPTTGRLIGRMHNPNESATRPVWIGSRPQDFRDFVLA
jgi:hypothetical protein